MIIWQQPYTSTSGTIVCKVDPHAHFDQTFLIDRPYGFGHDQYTFIFFSTPIIGTDEQGRSQRAAGSCIFYSPDQPQYYTGFGGGLIHSWFHGAGKHLEGWMSGGIIPLNRFFYPAQTKFIVPLLTIIATELTMRQRYWDDLISMQIDTLCINLSRHIGMDALQTKRRLSQQQEILTNIRAEMQENPHKKWTIDMMARKACLSRSRFSALYRSLFSISPLEDVIDMRLQKACWLLSNTTESIKNIAIQIGIDDQLYFSRLFTKRIGTTATAFRSG